MCSSSYQSVFFAVQLVCLSLVQGQLPGVCLNFQPEEKPCTSIADTKCSEFYGYSSFPNRVSQDFNSSINTLSLYRGLYTLGCSKYMQIYLCLALMPTCDDPMGLSEKLGPCESLCLLVTQNCSNVLQNVIGDNDISCLFTDCKRFPSQGCIDKDHLVVLQALGITTTTTTQPPSFEMTCPLPNNTFYTDTAKSFAIGWNCFWSILCFLSTLLTVLTFFIDKSRFKYPWRPIVYLAISYNIHSLAYLLSAALGRKLVTCPDDQFVVSREPWSFSHIPCILIFALLYYTMMAAFLWWVVLALGWFLVSALQWSHEALNKLRPFFHVVCWITPLLMTVALLAARMVGADELTGICFVVRDTSTSSFLGLLIGVILPLIVLMLVGVLLLVVGFLGILRVRAFMQQGGKKEEREILEKLMVRVGIFVAIYIIPASIVIACFLYELSSRPSWQPLTETCSSCRHANSAVVLVRSFLFLMIGVLTGTWIWSRKTMQSWARVMGKCGLPCCAPPQTAEVPSTSIANITGLTRVPSKNYTYTASELDYT